MEPRTLHTRLMALVAGLEVGVLVVALTMLLLPSQGVRDANTDYGYVYAEAKSSSTRFAQAAMWPESLLVLGSSEFSTPASVVPQVPAEVFGTHNYGVRTMLVGEAYDQCLWDAIAMGAFAKGSLPRNKVVLIVGLGQFVDGGLDASTFGERFSYTKYREFCSNPKIDEELRSQVKQRLLEQGIDETTVRSGDPHDPLACIDGAVLEARDTLRLRGELIGVRSQGMPLATGAVEQPDWATLQEQALADAQRMSTNNDWGVEDAFYANELAPALDGLKGARAYETYSDTPEYDDLELFLDVCDACEVTPLVIIEPSLGPFYDHIGISQETRESCYRRIRSLVGRHDGARIADFSDREYEPYFLYDIVHFGWTGWIAAERAIYDFAQEGMQPEEQDNDGSTTSGTTTKGTPVRSTSESGTSTDEGSDGEHGSPSLWSTPTTRGKSGSKADADTGSVSSKTADDSLDVASDLPLDLRGLPGVEVVARKRQDALSMADMIAKMLGFDMSAQTATQADDEFPVDDETVRNEDGDYDYDETDVMGEGYAATEYANDEDVVSSEDDTASWDETSTYDTTTEEDEHVA